MVATYCRNQNLLFSTLVAHWENGREQIEELLDELNGEDGLFSFNTDFLMRTCLFLVDAPMSFKVRSFNKETIEVIKHRWTDISQALKRTAVMLRDFGFNKKRLSSHCSDPHCLLSTKRRCLLIKRLKVNYINW